MVMPNWKKNLPMTPLMNATGRKIATTASVAASAAKVIWREPLSAASTRFSPFSWWRTMFSSTMMASSTTMPMARLRPSSVKVLSVKPKKYRTMKVPMIEVGIARMTFSVAVQLPRNSQHTNAVASADSTSAILNSSTDSSMKLVESKLTSIFMPSGSCLATSAMRALTPCATATVFEPRCLRMPMPTARSPLAREMRRMSSRPSSICATWLSRMRL